MKAEQRQPTEVLEAHAQVDALKEPRHERDLEAEQLAFAHERDQQAVGGGAEAEHHVGGPGLCGHTAEIVGAAEYGSVAVGHHLRGRRVGVEVADRAQAQLGLAR